jgi:hypothetical protein
MVTKYSIENILRFVNCPCSDDGRKFVETKRIKVIKKFLKNSGYILMKDDGLSLIYCKENFFDNLRTILISCHIDSLYEKYFYEEYSDSEIIGSFDNSICNAIILKLMTEKVLPVNVIVAFTGNEENDCKGVDDTVNYLMSKKKLWDDLELVISLDVTSEGYKNHSFTIENFFIDSSPSDHSKLHFNTKDDFKKYLEKVLKVFFPNRNIQFIPDDKADADESWQYDEYCLNCFSFCIPSKPHPDNEDSETSDWMHHNKGIIIKKKSIKEYSKTLSHLITKICNDIA